MPRAEVGTPKYIANKMKAKGLQKLRWYCQMCQKQCRDENGFKCHTTSESHQRQLLLFADNSRKYMDEFSYEFQKGYLEILRRQYGTKRVLANRVYQEYIMDRHHLHMNATRWLSLTGFVKWLGRTGKCVVDETERGWFITYIDRDPETLARQERKAKKLRMDKDDEEKMLEFVQKQVELGRKEAAAVAAAASSDGDDGSGDAVPPGELRRASDDEKIVLRLDAAARPGRELPVPARPLKELLRAPAGEGSVRRVRGDVSRAACALDEIMAQEESSKERANRRDHWLAEGIVVKVVTRSLGPEFHGQKGVVREVLDRYSAAVKLLGSGRKLRLDQQHLQTVIPAVGRPVRVVNGAYRGADATLLGLDQARFCVSVEIASGPLKGRRLDAVQYEDVCKLHVPAAD